MVPGAVCCVSACCCCLFSGALVYAARLFICSGGGCGASGGAAPLGAATRSLLTAVYVHVLLIHTNTQHAAQQRALSPRFGETRRQRGPGACWLALARKVLENINNNTRAPSASRGKCIWVNLDFTLMHSGKTRLSEMTSNLIEFGVRSVDWNFIVRSIYLNLMQHWFGIQFCILICYCW